MASVPTKIVLKSTTRMSLNDRFSNIAPTVQNIRANMQQEHQVSAANRRLAQQLANRPGVQQQSQGMYQQTPGSVRRGNFQNRGSMQQNDRNLQQRLGQPNTNVKNRLSLPGGGRGRGRGRGFAAQNGENQFNTRGRGGGRGGRGQGQMRGAGRGNNQGGRGGNRMSGQTSNFRGRGGQRGAGRGMRRGRGQGRGGRGRGANNQSVSQEDLDSQLDDYMAKTKSVLDSELDTYMSEAMS